MESRVQEYIGGVTDGSIVVGQLVRRSVERHLSDLERTDGLYYFDEEAAARALQFPPLFCRHSKGEWSGRPVELEPWQQFCLWTVFGWKRASDDSRRFRTVYTEVARKNGKSTLTSTVGLYGLVADGEDGAEVYSAATTREQAVIIHGEAIRMVRSSPHLSRRLKLVKNNISYVETYSKFEPLSADYGTLDGLNVHFGLIDELHAHKNRGVFDVIDTATGARRQPLIWIITTAGLVFPDSICLELRGYGERVVKGIIEDDTFAAFIYTIDADDDWTDPACWAKANPNLGVSVKLDDLERKAKRAQETPSAQNNFKTKHLNVWCAQTSTWIPVERWDQCKEEYTPADLRGMPCYAGLDLSSTTDISALSLVFPGEDRTRILQYYWVPRDNAEARTRRDGVGYVNWVGQRYIEATPGGVVDYDLIRERINELGKQFDIREIAIDRWNATQLATQLEGDGFHVLLFGQGFASMSGPMKELEALILGGALAHNGDPVTRWMFSNVSVKQDPAGNIKPDKASSGEKIDGVVALVMGVGRAMVAPDTSSTYESNELLVL